MLFLVFPNQLWCMPPRQLQIQEHPLLSDHSNCGLPPRYQEPDILPPLPGERDYSYAL